AVESCEVGVKSPDDAQLFGEGGDRNLMASDIPRSDRWVNDTLQASTNVNHELVAADTIENPLRRHTERAKHIEPSRCQRSVKVRRDKTDSIEVWPCHRYEDIAVPHPLPCSRGGRRSIH